MHNLSPETAGVKYICLIHAAKLLAALHGCLKAYASYTFNLMLAVGHKVKRLLLTILVDCGSMLSEISSAYELSDYDEVNASVYY